jgi:flavin reductase (DIM6/NTAB) family NADH-FMN oxidoreductase RutF
MEQKAVTAADSAWAEKNIRDFQGSPFRRIGDDWALLTAGNTAAGAGAWNTMTVSWGGLGVLWGRDVVTVYVRPHRYTLEFINAGSLFTLSFFDQKYRQALALCGGKSGRDHDKAAEAGLTPIVFGGGRAAGALSFREASEIIVCRKIYAHELDPANMLDPQIEKEHYPQKDFHRFFVGEILTLLTPG